MALDIKRYYSASGFVALGLICLVSAELASAQELGLAGPTDSALEAPESEPSIPLYGQSPDTTVLRPRPQIEKQRLFGDLDNSSLFRNQQVIPDIGGENLISNGLAQTNDVLSLSGSTLLKQSEERSLIFDALRQSGIDPYVYNPQGMVDPSCNVDPCACGWCPEEPIGSDNRGQFFPLGVIGEYGSTFQVDPTCLEDPCACGYCRPPLLKKMSFTPRFEWLDLLRQGKDNVGLAQMSAETQLANLHPEIEKIVIQAKDHEMGKRMVDRGSFCPDQGRRPWEMTRESYFTRGTARACTEAVMEMNAFHEEERRSAEERQGFALSPTQRLVFPSDLATGKLTSELELRARSAFLGYADACLTELGAVIDSEATWQSPTSRFLHSATAPGSVAALENSVGMLRATGKNRELCSGSLVDLGGAPYLVAAMHCLGAEQTTADGLVRLTTVWPDLEFTTYSGEKLLLSVASEISEIEFDGTRHDVFAVPLPRDVARPIVEMATIPLEAWEPMMIVGRNVYLAARARVNGLEDGALRRASTVIQTGADCRARTLDRGMLRYRCQTEGGTSGGGIFSWRNGRLVLAGLHLGAVGMSPEPLTCITGVGQGGANRGIALRWP